MITRIRMLERGRVVDARAVARQKCFYVLSLYSRYEKNAPLFFSETRPPLHIYVREIHLSGSCVMTTVNERTPILRSSETDDAPPRTWTRRPLYGAVFCSLLAFGTNSLVLSNGGWCPVQRRRQRESVRTSSSTRADPILVLSSEPGRASLHTDPVFAIAH